MQRTSKTFSLPNKAIVLFPSYLSFLDCIDLFHLHWGSLYNNFLYYCPTGRELTLIQTITVMIELLLSLDEQFTCPFFGLIAQGFFTTANTKKALDDLLLHTSHCPHVMDISLNCMDHYNIRKQKL